MKWRWTYRVFDNDAQHWRITKTGELHANTEQSAKAKVSRTVMPKGHWRDGFTKHFRQPHRRRVSLAPTLTLWKVRNKRW